MRLFDKNKCLDCGSEDFLNNIKQGEITCRKCGLVLDENLIDFSREEKFFEDGPVKGRTGPPVSKTKFDGGMRTRMEPRDIFKLEFEKRRVMKRLNERANWFDTAIERNLKQALTVLETTSSFLKLPKFVDEEAAEIYRLAAYKSLVRGRSIESMMVVALYAACRRHGLSRTLEEISESSGIGKKELGRTYRFMIRKLNLSVKPSDPVDYIPRFAAHLELGAKIQTRAVEILEEARDIELTSGRGPTGIAAAALYVATLVHEEKRTQREVADVAGVTEVTIRNRYKELIKKLKLAKEVEKSKKK